MYNLTIPKPCFENWDLMLPNEKGRHCNACAKTVVDFTVMTDTEVKTYFITHSNNSVCGRFKNTQLQRIQIELPQNIFRLQLPFWKKFLVVLLICFGSSFLLIDTAFANTNYTKGETIYQKKASIKKYKKAKPRKNKKKKESQYTIDFNDFQTSGLTVIVEKPKKQMLQIGWINDICEPDILGSVVKNSKEKKDSSPLESSISMNNKMPLNPTPTDPPTYPPTKNEMVLTTSSFAIRKYLFKKKKV
jgi:lipopolysaccharide export LptBFGC system permease protein LptF